MKEVNGDLLVMAANGEFDVVAHGCNCYNQMGKGIAVGVKRTFNEAYQADQATRKGDKKKLGTITYADDMERFPGLAVVNCYTQYTYWSKGQNKKDLAEYKAIRSCFKAIKEKWGGQGKRIGVPKLGAGLAGGDWEKISAIIKEELEGEDLTLVLFDGGR